MFSYIWPLMLVVLANTFYQICAKSIPDGLDPFASLTVTYFVGMAASFVIYCVTNRTADIFHEYARVNWAPIVLGIAIVGLEVGSIFAYKAGWQVSTMQIVQAALLAVILIFVGYFMYKEALTWNKIVGIIICLGGLTLINI